MKAIFPLFFVVALFFGNAIHAQEHGVVVGTSYGSFHEKTSTTSSMLNGPKFHYHAGYSYRQYFKHKIALDINALYGTQGTEYQWYIADSKRMDVTGKYVSLGAIASYECFKNLRVGLGADFAWYVNKIKSPATDNTKSHPIDIPIIARVSYSFKYLEIQLSYKQGTCDLMKSESFGRLTSRDLQLSIFVPIFK